MSAPDLDDLMDELNRGKVYECSLRDPKFHLDGLRDGESVFVDPRPAVIETLIHELLHRLKPTWGERRVTREARSLLCKMRDAELTRWWKRYNAIKRKRRPEDV